MEEVWKDIPGYEGYYQASNLGRIKNRFGRVLQPAVNNLGYLRLQLCKDGIVKNYYVHRAVWSAFHGPIPDGMVINHKDECPSNNCLDNLMLCTQNVNLNWGSRNEKARKSKEKWVIKLSTDNEILHFYHSVKQATIDTGISNISRCCLGKKKTAGGFKWCYAS